MLNQYVLQGRLCSLPKEKLDIDGRDYVTFDLAIPRNRRYMGVLYAVNKRLHTSGALFLHALGDVTVHIQRKGRRSVAEISLHRFYVVAVLQREHGERVAKIMHASVRRPDLGRELL